ncbi:phage tail sheath family protein [Candidatus Nitrososphaera sp. FF02]|uniref:phage tail sheath family protein n=1 Tax=Candidatus Nitrososphaera sp. FF02 TaxID=3398226 RepID=UPI0039E83C0B
MSHAIYQFFINGGREAIVVRAFGKTGRVRQAIGSRAKKTGIYALDKVDLFNILCIPGFTDKGDTPRSVYAAALRYCKERRAILLLDPPSSWDSIEDVINSDNGSIMPSRSENGAIFFPRILAPDPDQKNAIRSFVPCGAIAGVMARIDSQRGVWKSPAGSEATITGITGLTVSLIDEDQAKLNPRGINCLRVFPAFGPVIWGSRTMMGVDALHSEWKYLPVRRTALYIEESVSRGIQWAVFEPNDEQLWSEIRLTVGAFMHDLFRRGAFQGQTPRESYFAKCDRATTTQADVDAGIVNIIVGFAPLKPAEFVIIRIQQMARKPT